ncbi:MAG: sulfite exporter TauE/SafE family protein [Pseudomonadota bacterium]
MIWRVGDAAVNLMGASAFSARGAPVELTFGFLALAGAAAVFAGVSKGGFGSGAAFAAASILALVVEPGLALGIMLPLLMLIDVATLRPYWRKWNGRAALLLIVGGLPGVALGALLFARTNADVFRVLIGIISVTFVLWQLARSRGWFPLAVQPLSAWVGTLAGTVAGFTSFVSHAGGPPAAVYLLSLRVGKTEYQATTVLVFFVINIAKFVPYAGLGMFTAQTALANLVLAPFALLGAWLGVKAHRMVPERAFFALTYVLLTVTGCKLIWDGLT